MYMGVYVSMGIYPMKGRKLDALNTRKQKGLCELAHLMIRIPLPKLFETPKHGISLTEIDWPN